MVKKWGQRIYLAVIFLFLYLPILVLIVLSFNNSISRVVWGGLSRPSSEHLPRSASVP